MFSELKQAFDIEEFLNENLEEIFDYSSVSFVELNKQRDVIEEFIADRYSDLQSLDYTKDINRAFLFFLYDLGERLELTMALSLLWHLIKSNRIETGARLEAANLYLFNISDCSEYINRFDQICKKLDYALEFEEDNHIKVTETFANYYLAVLDRNPIWIERLKEVINKNSSKYSFLSSSFFSELLSFDTSDYSRCKQEINELKDNQVGSKKIPSLIIQREEIIEDSPYSKLLNSIENITFDDLKEIALKQVPSSMKLLDRGISPIKTEQDLFIYLKNFGNMHKAKIISALDMLHNNVFANDIEIIDWGCGQGLATIVFFECFKSQFLNASPKVILVEPSQMALNRAALHIKKFCPSAKVKMVCKTFDQLLNDDVKTTKVKTKIHFFSNVLDIETFSIKKLVQLLSNSLSGFNYFICVSPYINDLKTARIDSFKNHFKTICSKSFTLLGEATTRKDLQDEYWLCNYKHNKVNVRHGQHRNCLDYSENGGCQNKWTRVIRVFKVEL